MSEQASRPNTNYLSHNNAVEKLELFSADRTRKISLQNMFMLLSITESIMTHSISGNVSFYDQLGLVENIALTGLETIELSFSSLDDLPIDITLQVYSHTTTPSSDGQGKYVNLNLISPEIYQVSKTSIQGSFTGTITDIVNNIWTDVPTTQPITIHQTTGIQNLVLPGQTIYDAFEYLAVRAFDQEFKSSYFRFFSTIDGYNFINLERLIHDKKEELESDRDFLADHTYVFDQTTNVTARNIRQKYIIQELSFNNTGDALQQIRTGMNLNVTREFDIFRKKINEVTFNAVESFDAFEHLDNNAVPLIDENFINEYAQDINTSFIITSDSSRHVDHLVDVIGPRNYMTNALGHLMATAKLPGNTNLRVGDILVLDLSSFDIVQQNQQAYTGNWLIQSLTHTVSFDGEYYCQCNLIKDSFFG